jgi:hypothetical protein
MGNIERLPLAIRLSPPRRLAIVIAIGIAV